MDSFVAATLAAKAVPGQIHIVYVDNGLMRKNETDKVKETARAIGVELNVVDARKRFLDALRGVSDPEKKRKIIGEVFVRIFEEEAKEGDVAFLIQGTIAPDWI